MVEYSIGGSSTRGSLSQLRKEPMFLFALFEKIVKDALVEALELFASPSLLEEDAGCQYGGLDHLGIRDDLHDARVEDAFREEEVDLIVVTSA